MIKDYVYVDFLDFVNGDDLDLNCVYVDFC